MPTTQEYLHRLLLSDPLREPVMRAAIQALQLPTGSRGLDAGCGAGSLTLLLAEAVGPNGHVTGVDMNSAFLAHATKTAEESGLAKRVSFQQGDVSNLLLDKDSFDWAWSADCVGMIPAHPVPPLKELARVVRPGGSLAILLWSSQQLLPGYPLLEARLNATTAGIAPFTIGTKPERHHFRALGWFREAGLKVPTAQTFIGEAQAPLRDEIRAALTSLFEMRWGNPQPELTSEDWAKYQRLCQPESPDFILNLPDYYAFFTYSMFRGEVAG